eukprot:13403189-Heterocapsa_arctica.AAC.1
MLCRALAVALVQLLVVRVDVHVAFVVAAAQLGAAVVDVLAKLLEDPVVLEVEQVAQQGTDDVLIVEHVVVDVIALAC